MKNKDTENNIKECTNCKTSTCYKWFSGPMCRICYRQKPEIREKELKVIRKYKENNNEKILLTKKEWRKQNYNYDSLRCKVDIDFKIKKRLRTRVWHGLKHEWKTGSAIRDLGCSIDELKIHLESKFQPGMTWGNYGSWHIDHIIPLNSFDLRSKDQFLSANNYTNLQPLWAKENLSKGSKHVL